MQLNIHFNPAELAFVDAPKEDIYIVLDIMRATTTLAVVFDQGARLVLAAHTPEQAQEAARKVPGRLLCGERYTKTLPGFDFGNSPADFATLDLNGKDLVLTTSNGTRALFACPQHSIRLAGSFYNGPAVVTQTLNLAQKHHANISIVCAAEYGYLSLEDSACAGYLALELLHHQPNLEVFDSIRAAVSLYESYPPSRLREYAHAARNLIASGQEKDLEFCLATGMSSSVPIVVKQDEETPLLHLKCLK